MAADDPTATLRELRRVLVPGGRLVTVLWASPAENPWFAVPRAAIAATFGADRAAFARAFGRLGDPEEAADVHRAAGLQDVEATRLRELAIVADGAEHWAGLARETGTSVVSPPALDDSDATALAAELESRLRPYREADHLSLSRTLVLVTARR